MTVETLWFCIIAVMIAVYVVLDGFDLGSGIVHLYAARTDTERRQVLSSIGPVWDGNEVWLLAAGGTLYFAFPALYASSFSGFYLPLMMVLWLLMLRGIAIEFRGHLQNAAWPAFWDAVFAGSSALLTIFFGAALGNVVRGVPLDAQGYFFLPLWTDFRVSVLPGVLDWYTVMVGLASFLTLTAHGALWVVLKTEGDLAARARHLFSLVWWGVVAITIGVTAATFYVQPHVPERLASEPWGTIFPLLALAGLAGMRWLSAKGEDTKAFFASCAYIVGMLTSVVFGVYPYVLPSNNNPAASLDIYNTAAGAYGLRVGLIWFIPGMLLATAYFFFVYRKFAGKVRLGNEGH
ncbi:MAG: cytochrome d ubiquinol oxidase subunit II [Bryobacterales bacterium]